MSKWDRMSNRQKVTVVAVTLLGIGLLFWMPFTRNIILFILPLGSGIDDLIAIVLLVFGGFLLLLRFIAGRRMS